MSADDPSERDDDDDDEDARAILARRRTFVLTALAGLTLTGASECRNPFAPCLEVAPAQDAGVSPQPCLAPPPQACLQFAPPEPPSAPPQPPPVACLAARPNAPPPPDPGATPMPCLSESPSPPPTRRSPR